MKMKSRAQPRGPEQDRLPARKTEKVYFDLLWTECPGLIAIAFSPVNPEFWPFSDTPERKSRQNAPG